MKLLAPNVGWAVLGGGTVGTNLLWTTDGAHWRNISPNLFANSEAQKLKRSTLPYGVEPESIADVFFLDTHKGWVLFCCGQPDSTNSAYDDSPRYDLAMTTDAGTTWSIAHVTIPAGTSIGVSDNQGGQIAFADSLHGWMNLTGCGGHTCGGTLLITSDGGRTWRAAHDGPPGGADPFSLVTPTLGWQVSFPNPWVGTDENGELYVTRDGAKSWQQVSVPFPKEILSAADASQLAPTAFYHDPPTFQDSEHGFLPVTYVAEQAQGKSAIVLFETVDGGRTWKPIRALTNLHITGDQATYTVTVADSALFAATGSRDDRHVTLSKDGPDGRSDTDISSYIGGWQGLTYLRFSFATPKQGWMLGNGGLLSTTDGGATWNTLVFLPEEQNTTAVPQPMPSSVNVESMQLLTPMIGWTWVGNELYRTENSGAEWKNITVPASRDRFVSVFFLDAKIGWALYSKNLTIWDNPYSGYHREKLGLGITTDGGVTWSITSVSLPGVVRSLLKAAPNGQITFADPLHGWMILYGGNGPDAYRMLLATSDEGRHWDLAPNDPGIAGSICLVTSREGWLRSSSGDTLLVTRDGAKSWDKVSLPPPKEVYPATEATYDLPAFSDDKHGFLPVTYAGGLGIKSSAVLFATDDGGLLWRADRTLVNLNGQPVGVGISSAVVGQTWITANVTDDAYVTITKLTAGATLKATSNTDPGYYGADQFSFVTPSRGWVLLRNKGRLLSTADGGTTWDQLVVDMSGQEAGALQPGSAIANQEALRYGFIRMQLLAPATGWAEMEETRELYETEDGGNVWKVLRTPPGITGVGSIVSFFFQDRKRGWIMYRCHGANRDPGNLLKGRNWMTFGYQLASTNDGGATWSSMPVTVPDAAYPLNLAAHGQLEFSDSLHAWMNIDVGNSSGERVRRLFGLAKETNPAAEDISTVNRGWLLGGMLLVTSDAGQTWVPAPSMPSPAGYIRLVTPTVGWWLTFSGDALFVTRNGAHSWEKVSPAAPKEVYPAVEPTYDLPTFDDDKHGFLPVTFSGGEDVKSAAVLFATGDGGQSWRPDRILANLRRMPVGNFVPSTMAGSAWITANVSDYAHPTLTTLGPGARVKASFDASWGYYGTSQLSFVTPAEGWLLLNDDGGTFLSTTDGGVTWNTVNPLKRTQYIF